MALKYDLNGIFADLEEQVKKTQKQYEEIDETKENESIESPEDAPQTQEVAPAVVDLRGIELQGPDADHHRLQLAQDALCDAAGFKGIEVLRTVAVRPPELRVFDCDAFLGEVHAADEHERFFACINGFTLKFERIGKLALGA